jgi:long-chain acyl-CoA synthetase
VAGPVLPEYYAPAGAAGFSACDSAGWLAHPGTAGTAVPGELHIRDESSGPVPAGTPGTTWFKPGSPSRYFDDVEKTAGSASPDGPVVTAGDVGYLDGDGCLYLTDRATFMIISGGVSICPQEGENLLITHP